MKPDDFKTEEEATIALRKYITQQKKKGLTDKQITKKLVEQGFDDDTLERLVPPKEKTEDAIAKGIFKGFLMVVGFLILIYVLWRLIL